MHGLGHSSAAAHVEKAISIIVCTCGVGGALGPSLDCRHLSCEAPTAPTTADCCTNSWLARPAPRAVFRMPPARRMLAGEDIQLLCLCRKSCLMLSNIF